MEYASPVREMPTLRVEIDFANSAPGSLVFDDATLGLFDTGEFAGGQSFVDVTADVLSGHMQRGVNQSDRLYATAEAGTLEIDLDNRAAKYDPTNPDSPFSPYVEPMRRIRVRAPSGSADRPLWSGFVDS